MASRCSFFVEEGHTCEAVEGVTRDFSVANARKSFSSVLLRLEGHHLFRPVHCAQFALTKGRSGSQLILLLQQLIEKCPEWHLPFVVAAGDAWKAYDRMKHT